MSTFHIQAQFSTEQLLEALDRMPQPEFDQFAEQVLTRRLQRHPSVLPASEADLLLKINAGLPAELRQRYDALIARRDAASLTAEEHTELLHLTNQVEQREAERVEHLTALAVLRHTTVPQLMHDLGITAPDDD